MKALNTFILAVAYLTFAATLPSQTVSDWEFKVLLNDKEIGAHTYRVTDKSDSIEVETQAQFDVKFLFFTAYSYRHENREVWESGELIRMDSKTNDNGKRYEVTGSKAEGQFVVETLSEERKFEAPVMSFAYWKPDILQQSRLLNAQTGVYESVTVTPRGRDPVTYQGQSIPAYRYDIQAQDKLISLWYSEAGYDWLALETPVDTNRVLRYTPVSLPPLAASIPSAHTR